MEENTVLWQCDLSEGLRTLKGLELEIDLQSFPVFGESGKAFVAYPQYFVTILSFFSHLELT